MYKMITSQVLEFKIKPLRRDLEMIESYVRNLQNLA